MKKRYSANKDIIRTRNLVMTIIGLCLLLLVISYFKIQIVKSKSGSSSGISPTAPAGLKPDAVDKKLAELKKQKKELSQEENNAIVPLILKSSPLPFRSKDLDISYSALLKTFFVHKKTAGAESKLRSMLSPAIYQLYMKNDEYNLFVVGTHNVDYTQYAYESAENRANVKGVYAQDAPDATEPDYGVPNEEDFTNMVDWAKTATTFNFGGGVSEDGSGTVGGGGGGAADINLGNADPQYDANSEDVQRCMGNKQVYLDAEKITAVPWYILAGIHYREGTCHNTVSLRSGRGLGDTEPDVSEGCENNSPGQGKPVSDGKGGCTFMTLLDSAIDTGNLLKGKANDLGTGKDLSDLPTLIGALSFYNGGGNRNCGNGRDSVPYGGCPALYIGEDDPYVMNLYDKKHALMYIIYCRDGEKCPPELDGRPGVLTMAAVVKRK